jgi:hypothetical protein
MYEQLQRSIPIRVYDKAILPENMKGLYLKTTSGEVILIDRSVDTYIEKICVLAEEIGHYYTTYGDITDQYDIRNKKQELRALNWAYEKLVPLNSFILAFNDNVRNKFEFAELLGVTEGFLEQSIQYYLKKYGLCTNVGDYIVYFEPLGVSKTFP